MTGEIAHFNQCNGKHTAALVYAYFRNELANLLKLAERR